MLKLNKTYAGLALALTLAVSSAVYAQFSLINGGEGYGYGFGYGVGYGTDAGVYSYKTTGSPDVYEYGYGFVTSATNGVTSGGGGGGGSYYGGGVYTGSTNVTTNTNTTKTCSPYFVRYMRIGARNAEVTKLQSFLKTYEGETSLPVTGYFGRLTDAAVKRFQSKYGVTPVSGYVFVKTTAKLNEIYCSKVSQ